MLNSRFGTLRGKRGLGPSPARTTEAAKAFYWSSTWPTSSALKTSANFGWIKWKHTHRKMRFSSWSGTSATSTTSDKCLRTGSISSAMKSTSHTWSARPRRAKTSRIFLYNSLANSNKNLISKTWRLPLRKKDRPSVSLLNKKIKNVVEWYLHIMRPGCCIWRVLRGAITRLR